MGRYNLVSFAGLFVLMGFAWGLSAHRRKLNWRCIAFGVGIQLLLGLIIFRAPRSREAFLALNRGVDQFMTAARRGQDFVFGPLAAPMPGADGKPAVALATGILPMVVFFAALMGLLYYWGVMPLIIRGFAWVFARLMRISGAESLCAASNIFVGVESAATIRPYLARMTISELCTVLAAGMATIASTVLFIYAGLLRETFPTIAGHLISASIMSAPAAVVMSKILLPETGEPETLARGVSAAYERESGAVEALIGGAMAGVKLLVGIVALLIAFLGILGVINLLLAPAGDGCAHVLNWAGGLLGQDWHVHFHWSLEGLLGYVMWPFAIVIGVPAADAYQASVLLGERLVVTEWVAYRHLGEVMGELAPRTRVVVSYALCGFAHVASLAIFVGGFAALVPQRRRDLASVGPRALLAATLACLMTGAVAGVFFQGGEGLL